MSRVLVPGQRSEFAGSKAPVTPPPRRVLYSAFDVVPSPKGAATHIQHFVNGLVGAGHEVTLVTPSAIGLPAEEGFHGARLLRVGTAGGGNFLARALEFGEAVGRLAERDGPYDVVHFRSVWSGLPLLLLRDRHHHRAIFEANSLGSVELPFHYPRLRGARLLDKLRALEQAVLEAADVVVCVSRVSAAFLATRGAHAPEVIPNGVDPDAFHVTALPARAGRIPVALYAGTFADWQGLATLLEALPRVLARQPLRVRIVGRSRSRQRKELARRIRHLDLQDHVSVESAVEHQAVPALVASADVCLAPLAHDERNVVQGCCPIKLLEYLACGRPVIASDLPVVRELARDGREALLVRANAPDALAEALLQVLGNRRVAERLAERGARRVREHFTWQHAQARLLALYARVLAAPASSPSAPRAAPGSGAPPAPV